MFPLKIKKVYFIIVFLFSSGVGFAAVGEAFAASGEVNAGGGGGRGGGGKKKRKRRRRGKKGKKGKIWITTLTFSNCIQFSPLGLIPPNNLKKKNISKLWKQGSRQNYI